MPSDDDDVGDPRWYPATRLRDVLLHRWSAEIQAIATGPDAVRRTGLAGADLTELGATLKARAADLTTRGRPVDGPLSTLFE